MDPAPYITRLPVELSLVAYLLAAVAYMIWLLSQRLWVGRLATGLMGIGTLSLVVYLAWRSIEADRPPFAGRFESMITFACSIGIAYLILECLTRLRHAGVGAALVALLMLASTWLMDDAITPLMPALQNNLWLTVHVLFCMMGYGGFAVACALAIPHILSSPSRWHRAGLLALATFSVVLVMAKIWLAIDPTAGMLSGWLRILLPLALMHGLIFLVLARGDMPCLSLESRWLRTAVLLLITGALLTGTGLLLRSNLPLPMRVAGNREVLDLWQCLGVLVLPTLLALAAAGFLLVCADFRPIDEATGNRLGKAAYLAATFGFPFLSLGIVTGSIWANQAWGRYWGWDPKETSSLVAWCIYAMYLHLRLVVGGKKPALSWVLIAGFLMVLFTYLGINYLSLLGVESLHIYGVE